MKNLEKMMLMIIVIIMLGFLGTACDRPEKDDEAKDLERKEEMNKTDETVIKVENPYIIKLDKIANQIIKNNGVSVQMTLNQAYASYGALVENIYYADAMGKMILSPPIIQLPEDYDARERPWYKNALEEELYKPLPYQDQTVEKNIQTIAKALYKEDELIGVIGMDYELEDDQIVKNLDQGDEPIEMGKEKSLLSEEEREKLISYVKNLSHIVETEENLDVLKEHLDEQVEGDINGVETIYIANKDEIFLMTPYEQLPDNYNPSLRPWYELALKDSIYISEAFVDAQSNDTMVIVSKKIELEDGTVGVLGIDFIIDL